MIEYPSFDTQKELFEHLYTKKASIMAQKKATLKWADNVLINFNNSAKGANKQDSTDTGNLIKRQLIINTTLLFDSHKDVHLNGLWHRSVKNGIYTILNKQHQQSFEDIISEGNDIEVSVKTFTWKELGYNWKGMTEALTYDADIHKEQNPYMFNKYLNNKVRNHSVEMQYVKYEMAINDPDYKEEFKEWEKWIDVVANKQDVIDSGFFFPVYEAKHLGGAAVTKGSNPATPTLPINEGSGKTTLQGDSLESTQNKNILLNYLT